MFIDTHTHLYAEQFADDMHEAVIRAIDAGVTRMILPGISSQNIKTQNALAELFPKNCFQAAGLHPSDVKENYQAELDIVKQEIESGKYIAVGEIGIDLYWDKTYIDEQKQAFIFQINLAKKHKLPVIIHAREAFVEIFDILDQYNDDNLSGVFHSFTGTIEDARKIMSYQNFKIGINGIVTFKNSNLDKIVTQIPIDFILLETDSPYLAPVPKRGRRNESAYIPYIAEKIADIYQISISELTKITGKNAENLFTKLPTEK